VAESLLRALPSMLEARGARLERLEVVLPCEFHVIGDGLVHLGQALRCCSPTLKGFLLGISYSAVFRVPKALPDYANQMERLRVQWADVLAGVSACRELRVLVLPDIEVEPLFPPGTAFDRLTHLEICDHRREHAPNVGVMGLWELMASGGLPALAKLSVRLYCRWGGMEEEVESRVAPALEAAAGTLTHLKLNNHVYTLGRDEEPPKDVGYELGLAVGKLRRLKDLAIRLCKDGGAYHAFAQGLAASGGDRPLPLLWRMGVFGDVGANADLLASLLLPSVRVLVSSYRNHEAALLAACALRQAGYNHILVVERSFRRQETEEWEDNTRAIAPCTVLTLF
jgi:hypothetical protein